MKSTCAVSFTLFIGVLLSQPACHPSHPQSPSTPRQAVIRELSSRYASLHLYSDTGVVRDERAGKLLEEKWFRTEFERASTLQYQFGPAPFAEEGPMTGILATRPGMARIVEVGDAGYSVGGFVTLSAATAELQGVSLYGSLFVPRLLYGLDFCDCAEDSAWVLETDRETGGQLIRGKSSSRSTVLWVDGKTGLLRQVRIEMPDGEKPGLTTTITFQVTRAQ